MNPTTSMWVNIAATVIAALVGCSAEFTDLFGESHAKRIMAGVGLAGVVIGAVNTALHATSTNQPGPLAK